ncbi:MAG: DHH family phosphoesterase [Catonella sp.]|uniref:DHH family phosphoesterase n=1 Tax=Catonella sp. TaxID=2382125 RepID=UPI003F9F2CA6
MKSDGQSKQEISGKLRFYFAWPIVLCTILIAMNAAIYMIDADAAIVISMFLLVYIIFATIIYTFGKVGFNTELVQYAMRLAKTEKARLNEMEVPYAIVDERGNIHWCNNAFYDISNADNVDRNSLLKIFPHFENALSSLGEDDIEEIAVKDDREYRVVFRKNMSEDISENQGSKISVFFYDTTEINALLKENNENKMIMGLLYIDNYEEVLDNVDEVKRSLLSALIERKLTKFTQSIDAITKKLEKDKYIIIFKNKYLEKLEKDKFSILDEVKSVNIGNDMPVTISFGIGISKESYTQSSDFARAAIDMALGRGGDQVVIKEKDSIVYFGGKSQGTEKNTRVKARVKAHALSELIEAKDNVLIMGHKNSDTDAVGAAIGVYRICKTFNKTAHIVINDISSSIAPTIEKMKATSENGEELFVTGEKALGMVDKDTMLVVVDVNNRKFVECEELLNKVDTIVLLDHHRQGENLINNTVLSYIEPYASSSCELVAEILQYIDLDVKMTSTEAAAMYSGIMIDTNNFLTKTGVRTFEAAAFLKRNGADVTKIRKEFRTEMDEFKLKAKVASMAEIYRGCFAFARCLEGGKNDKDRAILGAKIANELMGISNVKASFVFTPIENKIYISARSIDELNVQVLMEKLGGGGHLSVAGAQPENVTIEEAENMVKVILDTMIDG